MNKKILFLLLLLLLLTTLAACAKSAAPPLPGDSVSNDGAVTLSPANFSTTATKSAMSSSGSGSASGSEPIGAIERRLFPAELVMEHQAAIALKPAQKDAITKEVARAQAELVKLQWELLAEKEKLTTVLDAPSVDEAKSKAAAQSLMDREDKIKAAHLTMLVRIKNVLTADQQAKLQAARDADRCPPTPPTARDAGGD